MGAMDNLISGNQTMDTSGYANKLFLGSTPVVAGKPITFKRGGGTVAASSTGGDIFSTVLEAKKSFYSWDDKKLNGFINRLGSYGLKNVNRVSAQAFWDMAVDGASAWYSGSNGQRKVTPEQYIQWYSKDSGAATADRLPQKQVYLYDKATIQELIDSTLDNTLGRKASADENKQFYAAIKKMVDTGTVTTTTTQMVGGKKMNVSKTTPGFTEAAATAKIESMIKTGSGAQQKDYLEKKSLDFGDFLSQLGG